MFPSESTTTGPLVPPAAPLESGPVASGLLAGGVGAGPEVSGPEGEWPLVPADMISLP